MNAKRILIVEDDAAIRRGVVDALGFHGYDVVEAADGTEGQERALRCAYDLLLLDLMLPGVAGLDILGVVRESHPTRPVIILTARGAEQDRIRGLKLGADDYVVKPFSVQELVARVEAVLRRSAERPSDLTTVSIPSGQLDLEQREIRFDDGARCDLSEREAELVRYLARHTGRAISREEILARVWGIDPGRTSTRTIDMHVARLREKLRDAPEQPVLRTVRGKGYAFVPAENATGGSTSPEESA